MENEEAVSFSLCFCHYNLDLVKYVGFAWFDQVYNNIWDAGEDEMGWRVTKTIKLRPVLV